MALRDKFDILKDKLLNCPDHGPEMEPTMREIYLTLESISDYSGRFKDLNFFCILYIDKLCNPWYDYRKMEQFLSLLLKMLRQHITTNLLHFIGEHVIIYMDNDIHDLKKEQLLMLYLAMLNYGKRKGIQLQLIFPLNEMTLYKFLDHIQVCQNKLKQKLELKLFHTLLPLIDDQIAESFFPGKRILQTALQKFRQAAFDAGVTEFTNCLNSQGDEMFLLETIYVTIGTKQYGKSATERTYADFNCTQRTLTIRILTQGTQSRPISIKIAQSDIAIVLSKDFARIDVAELLINLKKTIDIKQLNHTRVKKIKLRFNTQYLKQVIIYQNDSFLSYFFSNLRDFRNTAEKFQPEFSDTSKLQSLSSAGKHLRSIAPTDLSSITFTDDQLQFSGNRETVLSKSLLLDENLSMLSSVSYSKFAAPCTSSPTLREGSSKRISESFDSLQGSQQLDRTPFSYVSKKVDQEHPTGVKVLSNILVTAQNTTTYVRNTSSSSVSVITSGGVLTAKSSDHSQDLFSYAQADSDKENTDPNIQNTFVPKGQHDAGSSISEDEAINVEDMYYISSTLPESMSLGDLLSSSANNDSCFSPQRFYQAGSFRSPITLCSNINITIDTSQERDIWSSPLPGDFSDVPVGYSPRAIVPAEDASTEVQQGTEETFYSVNSSIMQDRQPSPDKGITSSLNETNLESVDMECSNEGDLSADRKRKSLSEDDQGDIDAIKKFKPREIEDMYVATGLDEDAATVILEDYFVPIPPEEFPMPSSVITSNQSKKYKPVEELNNTYSTLNLAISPITVGSQSPGTTDPRGRPLSPDVRIIEKREMESPVTIVDSEDDAPVLPQPQPQPEQTQEQQHGETNAELMEITYQTREPSQDDDQSSTFTLELQASEQQYFEALPVQSNSDDMSQRSKEECFELDTTPQFFKTRPGLFASGSEEFQAITAGLAGQDDLETSQYFKLTSEVLDDNTSHAVVIQGSSEQRFVDVMNISTGDMFEIVAATSACVEAVPAQLALDSEMFTEDLSMENVQEAVEAPNLYEIALNSQVDSETSAEDHIEDVPPTIRYIHFTSNSHVDSEPAAEDQIDVVTNATYTVNEEEQEFASDERSTLQSQSTSTSDSQVVSQAASEEDMEEAIPNITYVHYTPNLTTEEQLQIEEVVPNVSYMQTEEMCASNDDAKLSSEATSTSDTHVFSENTEEEIEDVPNIRYIHFTSNSNSQVVAKVIVEEQIAPPNENEEMFAAEATSTFNSQVSSETASQEHMEEVVPNVTYVHCTSNSQVVSEDSSEKQQIEEVPNVAYIQTEQMCSSDKYPKVSSAAASTSNTHVSSETTSEEESEDFPNVRYFHLISSPNALQAISDAIPEDLLEEVDSNISYIHCTANSQDVSEASAEQHVEEIAPVPNIRYIQNTSSSNSQDVSATTSEEQEHMEENVTNLTYIENEEVFAPEEHPKLPSECTSNSQTYSEATSEEPMEETVINVPHIEHEEVFPSVEHPKLASISTTIKKWSEELQSKAKVVPPRPEVEVIPGPRENVDVEESAMDVSDQETTSHFFNKTISEGLPEDEDEENIGEVVPYQKVMELLGTPNQSEQAYSISDVATEVISRDIMDTLNVSDDEMSTTSRCFNSLTIRDTTKPSPSRSAPLLPQDGREFELTGESTPQLRHVPLPEGTLTKYSDHASSDLFSPEPLGYQIPSSSTPILGQQVIQPDVESNVDDNEESIASSVLACSNRATVGITRLTAEETVSSVRVTAATVESIAITGETDGYELDPVRKKAAIKNMLRIRKYLARYMRPARKTRITRVQKELMYKEILETIRETEAVQNALGEKLFDC